MSSRIKFLSNLLLVRWSQAVFLTLQPRKLSIFFFLLLYLSQLHILQQQNFFLIWNNNFSNIGSNFDWLILVLYIVLFLKSLRVYSHFFLFIVFNMILKQLFVFSLEILFDNWPVTCGFYINLFWYTALVQPRGGTSPVRVVCEIPLKSCLRRDFLTTFPNLSLRIGLM